MQLGKIHARDQRHWEGPSHGQPHDPARLISTLAHMARALKEQQLHRSLSARVPRGTSTSHPNPSPRWGNRTVGLVGVGDNDEAALVSPWAAREGKLALGLTGRHRSRLEARGGDLAAAKNGACGRAPIGRPEIWDKQPAIIKAWLASGRPRINSHLGAAIPRFRRSPRDMPGRWDDEGDGGGEGTRVRVGSHQPCSRVRPAKRSGPHNPSLISPSPFAWAARAVAYLP